MGKTFEKASFKHVHNFLLDNHIITPLQSGFTRGDSTVNQLLDIYNTFCWVLDEGKEYFGSLAKLVKGFTLTLQETHSIHDSMNLPKIEFIAYIHFIINN